MRVSGGVDELLQAALDPDVRAIALASPNDPTGELLAAADLERLLQELPAGVAVLLDESLVEFSDAQPTSASIALLERHPRLLVFRSFSKAWGLAGLRIGYALGAPGSGELLAELEPDLGVSEISQAGALEALSTCSELIDRRVLTDLRRASAPERCATRARIRRRRQSGQLRVGRPSQPAGRGAGGTTGTGRCARRGRRRAR